MNTLVVIALRHLALLVGGAGVVSDDDVQQLAGALIRLGSIAYHVLAASSRQKKARA